MKKVVSLLLMMILLVSVLGLTASAYGGHHGQRNGQCSQPALTAQEICTVADCTQWGVHEHDGVSYYCANYGMGMGRGCGRGFRR